MQHMHSVRIKWKLSWFLALTIAASIGMVLGCQTDDAAPSEIGAKAVAEMKGVDGSSMGTVTLTQGPHGVLVTADVTGLSEGAHGFHVHGVGGCSPDFSAAGGHYMPGGEGHGFMHEGGVHSGDMPNIYAGVDGRARADVFTDGVSFASDADNTLFDDDGSAIIIHAGPDSYGESPGAGDRVACGVITRR